MNIYQEFLPTFLYIKRHKITGKLYFGKTTKNPKVYKGSGTHWLRHIKKYGTEHIETLWYCLYNDRESIKEASLSFSKLWNIVESKEWLNMIEEDGIGNGLPPGHKKTEEHKKKISLSNMGKKPWSTGLKLPKEFGEKISKSKIAAKKILTEQERKNVSEGTKKAMQSAEVKAKCSAPHIKNWILTSPTGEIFHIKNLRQFCKENNLNSGNLVQVAKGRYSHIKNWKCEYDNTKLPNT
jgi:hypothetical protein